MRFCKGKIDLLAAIALAGLISVQGQIAPSHSGERIAHALPQGRQQLGAGEYTRHLTVNGLERSYLLHIPDGLDPRSPVPVILAFHGGFGTAKYFAQTTEIHERAGQAGFVVVYPEGYGRSWNAGDCCGPAQRRNIDDVAFVQALLADLGSIINLDPRRIFATGFSNGGKLAYRLACELSERIAAIAPAATSLGIADCNPNRPVPVLHFHGLADRYAPFMGGRGAFEPAGVHTSVPETIAVWARLDGCTDEASVTFRKGAATCVTHQRCKQEAEVTLCTIERMGHQWPGFRPQRIVERRLGPGTDDLSATDMLLPFFQRHPMPPNP
jgi:polyhydroxybutyrate depolymerase